MTNASPTSNEIRTSTTHQALFAVPSLIVFDLDNTVWTPELYQLRQLDRKGQTPVANKDVKLFPGSAKVFNMIRNGEFPNTKFAVASRTKSVDWAHSLLSQFNLRELIDFVEIFPGNKKAHFKNIRDCSGIDYKNMIFFDDARDGKYGNCEPVSELGVLSVHCPGGIDTFDVFATGLKRFQEWDRSPNTIVEWDGTVSQKSGATSGNLQRQEGIVKTVNMERRFGFIRYGDRKTKDVFFHFSSLQNGATVQQGDKLSFMVTVDRKSGKPAAQSIEVLSSSATKQGQPTVGGSRSDNSNTVTIRAFSMNMPFAALLANKYKTLETRNGTMFVPYPEGTKMLLHVGQRTYPDGDKHIEVMKSGGLNDDEIEKLKLLPPGFGRGMAVAIVEIGKTYETNVRERSVPGFQRKVAAYGTDSGKMVTEIKRVEYLTRPFKVAAQGGVFKLHVDPTIIPDGWSIDGHEKYKVADQTKSNHSGSSGESKQAIYSISG